jgi:hypothetical protein
MTRFRLFQNLRTALMLLVAAGILALGVALWWANRTGLPETWRALIERELEKQGLHVNIARLRYEPLRGVVAEEIRVFSDGSHAHQVSRLERVVIEVDKPRLARGEVKVTRFELVDGRLDLPVDTENPDSQVLEATHVNAIISMPGGRLLEIREAHGEVEGIEVTLTARLLGYRPTLSSPDTDEPGRKNRMELLRRCLDAAREWKYGEKEKPKVSVTLDGDLSDRTTLHGRLRLTARNVEKNGHVLDRISGEAEWTGTLLTVTSLKATDRRGALDARLDFDMNTREGRFGATSTLDATHLLESWFAVPEIREVSFAGEQRIEGSGEFKLIDGGPPVVKLTGMASCRALLVQGVPFDAFDTSFSWREGNLYLRDLKLARRDGQATGKLLVEDRYVRLALRTNLPISVGRPFFVNHPFGPVLNDFGDHERTREETELEFAFDLDEPDSWVCTGHAKLDHGSYRNIPVVTAQADFTLNHRELDFKNGSAEFDYRAYPLQHAYEGAKSGPVKVKRVRYDAETALVEITGVEGTIWPAPVLRMFAKDIANHLETYRFHQPPTLVANGVVDTKPKGRTDLQVTFKSNSPADYDFLGETLLLESPSGQVRVQNERVTVSDLQFSAFGGPVRASLLSAPGRSGNGELNGEFSWTRLAFNDIASKYGFETKSGGEVTGRIEFNMALNSLDTMSGKGLVGLDKGELFSVPIFGPLSPLVSGILADKRAGFEKAGDAFCTFSIRQGVLRTNDFITSSPSMVFTGDARVDLPKLMIDMTMRMNARGLLGIITLPLRPFYGLFQFHGSGPLKTPAWENVMFTSPPEDQKDMLLNPPKATIIREH